MFARLPMKSASAVAVVAAGMLIAPAAASAQTYSYQGPQNYGSGSYGQRYDYDQSRYGYDQYGQDRYGQSYCRSDTNQRRAAGATLGAVLGAVAGSQLGARGVRTEGSVLGGVVGAAIGAGIGDSTARCDDRSGYGYGYDDPRYGDRRYEGATYGYPSDSRYDDRSYGYDRYDYGRSSPYPDDRYQSGYQNGCRTIETQSRSWDGRIVTRYEQSCPRGY